MQPDFQQYSMMVVLIGLGGLAMVVSAISTVIKNVALIRTARNPVRTPPIEEEAAKTYATKAELGLLRCEWQTACKMAHEKTDKTFGEIFSIMRAQNKEITERLDKYHGQLEDWQRGIERQIGKIEGSIDNQ